MQDQVLLPGFWGGQEHVLLLSSISCSLSSSNISSWFRAGFGRAGLLPRKMTQLPTFALLIPHYQCHPGSTCRHLGTVLCTHNPTSLKLMQSPRKSRLCSFNTGKDQRLTSAQRLSVALDQMACHCLCSCRHDAESNGTGIC